MLLERWDNIDAETLAELCESNAPETISLDFKQELYGSTPDDKSEFLKDVCALANAEGGDLVFGIAEAKGGAGRIMPITDPSADRAMRKMGQILDGSVEPRLPSFQWKHVTVEGGYVLILRVTKSLIGPHRLVVNNFSRFPIRNGTHIADMSYDQLRDAFGRTATLLGQAKLFRAQRLAIIPDGLWKPVPKDQPHFVVHLIPLASMTGRTAVDLVEVRKRFNELQGYRWMGTGCSFNLDGLLVWDGNPMPNITRYTQVFRDGALETVDTTFSSDHNGGRWIASAVFACAVRACFASLLAAARKNGFNGSAVASVSLGGVKDFVMYMGQFFNTRDNYKSDRNDLILPEIWIENIETIDIDAVAKPLLDVAWQAFGIETCSYYDDTGNWCPERRFQ